MHAAQTQGAAARPVQHVKAGYPSGAEGLLHFVALVAREGGDAVSDATTSIISLVGCRGPSE